MECTQFSDQLEALLDGTLPAEERTGVEAHAAACPRCHELYMLMSVELESPSSETPAGLTEAIYSSMGMIRIYLKPPGGPPDYDAPVGVGKGDTLEYAARSLHKDWARKLKFARLWGSGKFDGQRIGRDYILSEGDVIELHG